jgi:hypothetical protein
MAEGGQEHMHSAALAIYLLWYVWGVDCGGFILESRWLCGISMPLTEVVVEVQYCVWCRVSESVVVVVSVIIYD